MSLLSSPIPNGLLERITAWAELYPRNLALVYLADGENVQESLDFEALLGRVDSMAAWLSQQVAPGSRVLIAAHSEVNYLLGLLACMRADVVAIPTLTTVNARALERIQAHGEDAGACALLADQWIMERRDRSTGNVANAGEWIHSIPWLNLEDAERLNGPVTAQAGKRCADDECANRPAYLQYTSGSTNRPKGVIVTHANLAAQLSDLERVLDHRPGSVVCNWMPLFHDFGLVMSLQAIYSGGTVVMMSAVPTVQRPGRWLQAISNFRAVTSAAPNFMFDRCVERVPIDERHGLELSGLRHLLNAAEPIQPNTLRTFTENFRAFGFQESALMPAYGLAEATLLVTTGVPGKGFVIEEFDAEALLAQRAVIPNDSGSRKELVSCGEAVVADSICIVNPDSGQRSHSGTIGEVWVTSPSVAAGFWNRESESADAFGARLGEPVSSQRYLRTGDLGFLFRDQLFITGRLKDLVIVRGENHYPHDIELTVAQSHPYLEPNAGAAFAIDDDKGEQLVIVHEVRREVLQRIVPNDLFDAIRQAVAEAHGLESAHIVLLRPAGLLRTSSGKVQRRACRQGWLDNTLPVVAEWNGFTNGPIASKSITDSLALEILSICRRLLRIDSIDAQTSLFNYGVDSLKAVEILLALEERWKVAMDLADFADHPSVALLAKAVHDGRGKPVPAPRDQPFFLGDQLDSDGDSHRVEELISQVRQYVTVWEGKRAASNSLLVGRNTDGVKVPLFWVFQGEQEFIALADRLGKEQPVYGLRSGHQVMDYTEANVQILATSYRREIETVHPQGPYLLGGNCQGGLIALAVAQQFWRLQQPVALLALLEWAFPPQPYQGRVALLWGESSWHKNPYFKFRNPEFYWRRAFGSYSVDIISGGHGEFFSGANLHVLADTLTVRLHEAIEVPPLFLPNNAHFASYRVSNAPKQMTPGHCYGLNVDIHNSGVRDWAATEFSGLRLGNHWLDAAGQMVTWLDAVVSVPATPSGGTTAVTIPVNAPPNPGTYLLQLDLVEEGVAWFSERGVEPLTLTISVVCEAT